MINRGMNGDRQRGAARNHGRPRNRAQRTAYLFATSLSLLLTLTLGVGAGILLDRLVLLDGSARPTVPSSAAREFDLIAEAWRTIDSRYVNQDALVPIDMAHGAIAGIVETLDDPGHTRFLTPTQAESHRRFSRGQFEGIGAYVEEQEERIIIQGLMENSPAEAAGLRPGDIILEVNGESVAGLSVGEVVARVAGPAGTQLTLTIEEAETGQTRTVSLQRAAIDLELVTWAPLPGTGLAHLRISTFSQGAANALRTKLNEISATEGITGIVLDLRDNPGGLLWEAVDATSYFIEDGTVLLRIDARGNVNRVSTRHTIRATALDTVVLVNGGTASGAEIMTGALQDNDRAIVIGTVTAGAGTVLNEFPLRDGSVLLLAVEEWRTPGDRVIWHAGLEPDIVVGLPEDALLIFPNHAMGLNGSPDPAGDPQLQRAIDLLTGTSAHP